SSPVLLSFSSTHSPPSAISTLSLHDALPISNDCQLFTGADVTLDSPECVNALGEYQAIVAESVGGEQDVESTRAAYLSGDAAMRSEEHTSELQSRFDLVCRLLLEKKKRECAN